MFRQGSAEKSIFKDLTPADLALLEPLCEAACLHQDKVIFDQGRNADYLYILLEGEVVVNYKPYDGPELTVGRIHPGGVFGWSAILGRQVYTALAMATVESTAIRIRGAELRNLCESKPQTGLAILEKLAEGIAERLNSTRSQIFTMLVESMDLALR